VATARLLPRVATWVAPLVDRAWKVLLLAFAVLAIMGFWRVMVAAGPRVALAAAITTLGALAVGHWLGGHDPGARTAVAITSAARNPGLALLVAALNDAPAAVRATLLTYMIVAAFTILPYALGRGWLARGMGDPHRE
jgi:BASS family bile acid:Na+ symporter